MFHVCDLTDTNVAVICLWSLRPHSCTRLRSDVMFHLGDLHHSKLLVCYTLFGGSKIDLETLGKEENKQLYGQNRRAS
jgi:hypothetical protein